MWRTSLALIERRPISFDAPRQPVQTSSCCAKVAQPRPPEANKGSQAAAAKAGQTSGFGPAPRTTSQNQARHRNIKIKAVGWFVSVRFQPGTTTWGSDLGVRSEPLARELVESRLVPKPPFGRTDLTVSSVMSSPHHVCSDVQRAS